jgi:hypothetical protein
LCRGTCGAVWLILDEKLVENSQYCAAGTSAQLARRLNVPKIVLPAKAGIQFCFVTSNS